MIRHENLTPGEACRLGDRCIVWPRPRLFAVVPVANDRRSNPPLTYTPADAVEHYVETLARDRVGTALVVGVGRDTHALVVAHPGEGWARRRRWLRAASRLSGDWRARVELDRSGAVTSALRVVGVVTRDDGSL